MDMGVALVFKFFRKTMQGRIIIILFIFLGISMGISIYSVTHVSQQTINSEKASKLLQIAEYLSNKMGDRTYKEILIANGAESLPREEQIAVLSNEFYEITEDTATMFTGLGTGFYSLELDAIIAYGPHAEYGYTIGMPIGQDHPGRDVMANNEAQVKTGTMVRGDIMNAMVPLERNGEVIGYVWANELTSDIQNEYRSFTFDIVLLVVIFFVIAVVLSIVATRRMTRNMDTIIAGVKQMRNYLTRRIPPIKGDFSEVAESINSMADHIEKNAKEHEELMLAEAANLAQRDFLARMSHEIRTPMNGVLGMTRMAIQAPTQEKTIEYLNKIQSSATLLLGIINDILDFSKIEANMIELESSPFKLHNAINNPIELIAPRVADNDVALSVTIDESVPALAIGDSQKLSQILLNLLGNAAKFCNEGQISTTVRAESFENNRFKLVCIVGDTGIGMSEEQIDKLFQPFTQADSSMARKYGGTGLGLSISKKFVNLMGGEICVRSELNVGSEFEFYIWLETCEQEAFIEENFESLGTESYKGRKVLIAEDNDINAEIAVSVLSELGLQCDVAENGEFAVDMYKKNSYDLIFMDIRMPVMDGLEATRNIRRLEAERGTGTHIPIIAMTANAMQEDRKQSMEAGMDAHVSKPIDIKEIEDALRQTFGISDEYHD